MPVIEPSDLTECSAVLREDSSLNTMPTLFRLLNDLQSVGGLRAIDVQFGLFIYQKQRLDSSAPILEPQDNANTKPDEKIAIQIGVLACLLSHEFGRGHICIHLKTFDIVEALSLNFWFHLHPELRQKYACALVEWQHWDWRDVCQQAFICQKTTIHAQAFAGEQDQKVDEGSQLRAFPLVFEQSADGGRVYLARYWHYERQVASGFLQRSQSLVFSSTQKKVMKSTLDRLFSRDYTYLWQALKQADISDAVTRQRAVCEYLDVEKPDDLDFQEIESVLVHAKTVDDLDRLDKLVPESVCLNWQKVAAAVALTRQFSVISGGPGTGKTTTVAKLLAALMSQSQASENFPIIKLVAPTGKAAARLTESIGLAVAQLPVDDTMKAMIPTQSSTIHRLLGARPNTVQFKHNKANPLHVDILVVDEASMVDLPMMHRLLEALPSHARLILLGDKDQLASVEAGAILGDICLFSEVGYQPDYAKQLGELTGFQYLPKAANGHDIADSLCMLRKSYRFHARSGIGQLAKAINAGNAKQVESIWRQGFLDISFHPLPTLSSSGAFDISPTEAWKVAQTELLDLMVEGYRPYCESIDSAESIAPVQGDLFADVNHKVMEKASMELKAKSVLKAFSHARLLCAVREGEYGVQGMNQMIEQALTKSGFIHPVADEPWYVGKPIMVNKNDSTLGLHNGDIGICLLDKSEQEPRLRVYFEMPDGRIKGVLPSRVPQHDVAFAMTIHKSQGSEFEHTVLLLPEKMNQILTRELIYTGVTRAKSRLNLFANPHVLAQGVSIKTLRTSGLSERLSCS